MTVLLFFIVGEFQVNCHLMIDPFQSNTWAPPKSPSATIHPSQPYHRAKEKMEQQVSRRWFR